MASCRNGTLYVGVTADLLRRGFEHREGMNPEWRDLYPDFA
jgi:predicted GIY-YIG superfamily endonuclease